MKKYERFYEMANLTKSDTGLNYKIWIQVQTGKEKHWARIKVEIDNQLIPISISDTPEVMIKSKEKLFTSKELERVKKWIIKNQDILIEYWNSKGDMSLQYFFKKMNKI